MMYKSTETHLVTFCMLIPMFVFFIWGLTSCDYQRRKVNHVIIIGIDGMGGTAIELSDTPTLDSLMEHGAYTLNARGVLPTSSSPNWASMIMGAGPEQHGITSNEWQKDHHTLPPIVQGEGGTFPTIFSVVKKASPQSLTGAIYQWKEFGRLIEKEFVDFDTSALGENRTVELAREFIVQQQPAFCFIHIDHVDGAGHKWGYDSEKYHGGVEKADMLIKEIIASVEEAGIKNETLIIISADHGGNGKSHGGETLNEIRIPVILAGNGVKKNYEIVAHVNIYDIAPTVAYLLGYEPPECWIGKPITAAFN